MEPPRRPTHPASLTSAAPIGYSNAAGAIGSRTRHAAGSLFPATGGAAAGAAGAVGADAAAPPAPAPDIVQLSAEIVLEFLEVVIHSILYYRAVYPPELFQRRRKYSVAVYMSRHPVLNDYVFELLSAAKGMIEKNQVEKLAVVLMDETGNPVERFWFELDMHATPAVPCSFAELEDALGAFLAKLALVDPVLGRPNANTSFTVLFYTHEAVREGHAELEGADNWVFVTPTDAEAADHGIPLRPLKSLRAGHLAMQSFVEKLR